MRPRLLLLALLAGLAAAAAAVLVVGLWLAAPVQRAVGTVPEALAGAEPVEFASTPGTMLHGWFMPPAHPGAGMVMVLHGWRESRLNAVGRAATLHQSGYGVLLFDLQAHGESLGRHVTFGRLEGADAAAARAYLARRLPDERVAAIGFSLGGAALLLAPVPLRLQAVVLEGTFPTVDDALRTRLVSYGGTLVAEIAGPLLEALMRPVLGVNPATLRPIDHIAALNAPVLVIGGSDDRRTPPDQTRALFAAAREPKELWLVPDAGHVDFERHDPAAYWGHVLPFLTNAFRRE